MNWVLSTKGNVIAACPAAVPTSNNHSAEVSHVERNGNCFHRSLPVMKFSDHTRETQEFTF